jgi:hypothetical protein
MQATFGTLLGYVGAPDRSTVVASTALAGGGANLGSTCGVVTGGCLGITLAHLADVLSGEAGKGEALYERLNEYTGWFESEFGSTLCRERSGADMTRATGVADYLLTGKVVTRCVDHIGLATARLLGLINRPLEGGGEITALDRRLACSGGYCAAEVMQGVRTDTGYGSLYMEQLSLAFDGGIGLSGGLCGALAGALMPLGIIWGIDPKYEGFVGTLEPLARGMINQLLKREEPELWSQAGHLMSDFKREFASLECRDIVGRSFANGSELAEHMAGAPVCARIKDWCRERTTALIAANTVFSG